MDDSVALMIGVEDFPCPKRPPRHILSGDAATSLAVGADAAKIFAEWSAAEVAIRRPSLY